MTDMKNTEWRSIPGMEGFYEVSETGLIRSLSRTARRARSGDYTVRGKLLNLSLDSRGYLRCAGSLGSADKRVMIWPHSAVAAAFIGPRPEGHDVRHLDGNALNNHISNIAYGTRAQNVADAKRHGTFNPGVTRKLTSAQVIDICKRHELTAKVAAKEFGCSETYIAAIRSGVYYRELTDGIRLPHYHRARKGMLRSQSGGRAIAAIE